MKLHGLLLSSILIFTLTTLTGQNLPSLLTGRNINSTFSILAYDPNAQEWGIAVATNNIYVGNSTIYIQPGVGAFSVIAETEPRYAINGFEKLIQGKSIREAILETKMMDNDAHYRQVSGIDKRGNVFAFTGESLKYWNGYASHYLGKNYVVMGNQLADSVLICMAGTFENSEGTLAERLLKSLVSGQIAGGQVSGKQSAAVVVKGTHNEWFNQIDLRVDHSENPFLDLQILMDYHYGRIKLNQSFYAVRQGDRDRAEKLLSEAKPMLNGWNGIYGKIALAYSLLDKNEEAISIIQKAILENPDWRVNLPAFYYLRDHPKMIGLINPAEFTPKDWQQAIGMLIELNRCQEAIELTHKIISEGSTSSFLHFLVGKAYLQNGDLKNAKKNLELSLELDRKNAEALKLLMQVDKK